MELISTSLEGLIILKLPFYEDSRGGFMESYQHEKFSIAGIDHVFVQDNESISHKNVLRGLHFQIPPFSQGKLVRVPHGAVLDVVVDLRKNSTTFGLHESILLSSDNRLQLWIPPGFAHGFLSLEENTVFSYKCSAFYNKDAERSIVWNDSDLNIQWGIDNPVVSQKDMEGMLFKDFISPF
jgi:dTDP-4-dehydrorhamnose 3,5-epimerase